MGFTRCLQYRQIFITKKSKDQVHQGQQIVIKITSCLQQSLQKESEDISVQYVFQTLILLTIITFIFHFKHILPKFQNFQKTMIIAMTFRIVSYILSLFCSKINMSNHIKNTFGQNICKILIMFIQLVGTIIIIFVFSQLSRVVSSNLSYSQKQQQQIHFDNSDICLSIFVIPKLLLQIMLIVQSQLNSTLYPKIFGQILILSWLIFFIYNMIKKIELALIKHRKFLFNVMIIVSLYFLTPTPIRFLMSGLLHQAYRLKYQIIMIQSSQLILLNFFDYEMKKNTYEQVNAAKDSELLSIDNESGKSHNS